MASVAFDAPIISEKFYVDLVLLTLVTSTIAGAWLDRVVRHGTSFTELQPQSGVDSEAGAFGARRRDRMRSRQARTSRAVGGDER